MAKTKLTPIERFVQKYVVSNTQFYNGTPCWIWKASISPKGYGRIQVRLSAGKFTALAAHRFSYEHHVGPIPVGLELDHLCRNRACVNPAHLEAVTHKVNILRGFSPSAICARKTHCKCGHPLVEGNLYNSNGGRGCLACKRIWTNQWRVKRKALGLPYN